MKTFLRFALSALVAASLAACGGGEAGDGGGDERGGSKLTMVDNAFEPSTFTVQSGAEVTLVNDGAALHNFSVEGEDINVDVNAGETATQTLDLAAGTYTMICVYHRALGMEGTLTVE